jgi:predicted nuclease with TOPRIM domain
MKGLIESIKHAFRKVKLELDDLKDEVREELDDNRETFNEINSDYQELEERVADLEHKFDRLIERIDDWELKLNPKFQNKNYQLSKKEQEVYLVLHMGKNMTVTQMAKRLTFTTDMVNLYLFSLINKGVPIQQELINDVLVFSIDAEFRDIQTRKNILNIDPRIARQLVQFEM